jgi:predicted negative regulator of RcsB-dependent stress response
MAKRKKLTTKELKHDRFRDWYEKQADWARQRRAAILRIIYRTAAGIAAILVIVFGYSYWERTAERRLATAFDIFNAQVSDTPPADTSQRHYTTEDEKYRAALDAFKRVSDPWYYSLTDYAGTAAYYVAVCQIHVKPEEGKAALEKLANGSSTTARLARLALAEHLLTTGDAAGALYQRLVDDPGDLPKARLQLELARALAAQQKKQEAVNLYLQIIREHKKEPIAREALTRLARLEPAALDQAPPEEEMQADTDVLARYKKK